MAELFVAGLDAQVFGAVRTGAAKPKRPLERPWYMRDPDDKKPAGKTGQELWTAVDRLAGNLSKGAQAARARRS